MEHAIVPAVPLLLATTLILQLVVINQLPPALQLGVALLLLLSVVGMELARNTSLMAARPRVFVLPLLLQITWLGLFVHLLVLMFALMDLA
jgi:hypothetical protein